MDEFSITLPLDHMLTNALYSFAPHRSCFNLDDIRKISSDVWLPKPVISSVSNWLHKTKQRVADAAAIQQTQAFLATL